MQFLQVFILPFRAARLILKTPKLLVLSLIPILITLIAYYYLIGWIDAQIIAYLRDRLLSFGLNQESHWFTFLNYLVKILGWGMGMITFGFVANFLAVPFSDFLAEATEGVLGIRSLEPVPFSVQMKRIFIDLIKSVFAATIAISALLLAWIPFVGWVSVPIFWLLVAFQFLTYPQTRREFGFRQSAHWIGSRPLASLIFGAVYATLLSVPLLSTFMLPIAVVSGTLFFAQESKGPAGIPITDKKRS